ncbi:hypothetical protein Aconfl_40230 [Algoriphagus confluentis]|uniref:Uncharacterized protein n=2 Tax=Algoriphagus confluentis TaxID=1697556 RepID=A0ABQ6PTS4_9BACT|nr:hypothetical protein Aconfl_40230 [Algoriphagus confluentis]
MEDMEKQKDLTWLEHLQKNSWEPEVIISGISLAFLFVIPSRLFEFSVILIQDYGLEQIPAQLILVYFSLIITVFKLFLIIHLIMRFIWAGLLGISYAFPNGVIKENLFKYSQNIDYFHPVHYLLKLERWCSMLYGFPITVAIPIFSITLYLLFLIGIYLIFNLNFEVVYLIFMLTVIGIAISGLVRKNTRVKEMVGKSMSGTIGAVYQSNLGKWSFIVFSLVLILVSVPFTIQDLKGFSGYQAQTNLDEEDYQWPNEQIYYEEFNPEKKRFPRAWTPRKRVSKEDLEIYLPYYVRESKAISQMNVLLETDSISWENLKSYSDQFRIYLNDSLIHPERWRAVKSGHSGQKAIFGQFPIAHLEKGIHEVRVEKLVYLSPFLGVGNELRHRDKWARFEFIKE